MYIFVAFILTFLLVFTIYENQISIKVIILYTALLLSGIIVAVTEGLSFFYLLNYKSLFIFWSLFCTVILVFLCWDFKKFKQNIFFLKNELFGILASATLIEKTLISTIIVFLSGLFYQGLVYPPNNWDSLTYHMSRIMIG